MTRRVPRASVAFGRGRTTGRAKAKHSKRHDQRAQQQQRQVGDAPPPCGRDRHPLQEHQRRKAHRSLAFAAAQVQQHRDDDRRQSGQDRGDQEQQRHQRALLPISRRSRKLAQRRIEWLVCLEHGVIDVLVAELALQLATMRVEYLLVLLAQVVGAQRHPCSRFRVLEVPRRRPRQVAFGGVHQVKDDDVVAAGAETAERAPQDGGILVAIGHQHHDARPAAQLCDAFERFGDLARALRLDASQRVQDQLQVSRRRRHDVDDVTGQRDQPDAIALLLREPRERRYQEARIIELRVRRAAEIHRRRRVEREHHVGVGVRLVCLEVEAIGAAVHAPVDAPQVVAGLIGRCSREIDRRSLRARPVHARA